MECCLQRPRTSMLRHGNISMSLVVFRGLNKAQGNAFRFERTHLLHLWGKVWSELLRQSKFD
jgi:hypothetical protein